MPVSEFEALCAERDRYKNDVELLTAQLGVKDETEEELRAELARIGDPDGLLAAADEADARATRAEGQLEEAIQLMKQYLNYDDPSVFSFEPFRRFIAKVEKEQ